MDVTTKSSVPAKRAPCSLRSSRKLRTYLDNL